MKSIPLRSLLLAALTLTVALPVRAQTTTSPGIHGLAHIAVSVASVERARNFYAKLGFEEAFHFGDDKAPTQSFLKINDRQFIELYPASAKQPEGFLHLCFDGDDLNALYSSYAPRGLSPTPVRKAHAGNLLFTMEGPEKQNIEYTQYLPGSLHSEDHGKHLGDHRIADTIFAVALAMRDRDAARTFYLDKLAFIQIPGHPWLLSIPGSTDGQILLETGALLPHARVFFHVADLKKTAADLKQRGIASTPLPHALSVTDPDGNLLVFQSAPDAE